MTHTVTAVLHDGTTLTTAFAEQQRAAEEYRWVRGMRRRGVDEPAISWTCTDGAHWVLNPAHIRRLATSVVVEEVTVS